jgi:DNA-binding MarR family transcriptional regulator
VQNQFAADFAAASAEFGMRSGLFSSLAVISANPGISQQELSGVVGLDKSVAVQIVDDLEARGLARRERSTIDRRRHSLTATPEGEAFLETMFARLEDVEGRALRQFTPEERAELSGMLDRMYAILMR